MDHETLQELMKEMTDAAKEEQRRSFAFGNANISNPLVTRGKIDEQAEGNKVVVHLDGGKYTYIKDNDGQRLLRHGETWRDITGDKFILAAMFEIYDLYSALNKIAMGDECPQTVAEEALHYSETKIGWLCKYQDPEEASDD